MENKDASLENILDFMDKSDFAESTGAIDAQEPDQDDNEDQDTDQDPDEDQEIIDLDDDQEGDQQDDAELEDDSTQDDDQQDDQTDTETKPEQDNSLTEYYKTFSDLGLLNTDEGYEFDGSLESLEKAVLQTKQNNLRSAASSLMESFPNEFKPILAHILNGGTSLKDFVSTYVQEEDVTTLDVDNKENQRKILREYYRNTTKYDDAKIERFIDRLEDNGDLLDEAVDSLTELKQIYASKRQELNEAQKLAEEQKLQAQKEYRESISNALKSTEQIASSRKAKVQAFLFNPVTRGKQTDTDFNRALVEISSNPQHLVQLADILLDYSPDKGINLERLNRRKKSEAVSEIRKKLESITDIQSKMKGGGQNPSNTNFD